MFSLEHIHELPPMKDVIAQYEGRGAELNPPSTKKEKFPVTPELESKINDFGKEMAARFYDENFPIHGLKVKQYPSMTRSELRLDELVIDKKNMITLVADRLKIIEGGQVRTSIVFAVKGGANMQPVSALYFEDMGNGVFELNDRYTEPKYRGYGFADLALKASEGFLKQIATQHQPVGEGDGDADGEKFHAISAAETGQLDVIYWLWKNGYRPKTSEDWEKLDKVLSADPDLKLCENMYVFEKDKDEYSREKDGQIEKDKFGNMVIDFHKSVRINFVKTFDAGAGKAVSEIAQAIRVAIDGAKT